MNNYRSTPHPATGITPAAMLFRDPPNAAFPRTSINDEQVEEARQRDEQIKLERQQKINSSKYTSTTKFKIDEQVLIRNFNKNSKFDPHFQPEPCTVIGVEDNFIVLERKGTKYRRHRDDVKKIPENTQQTKTEQKERCTSAGVWAICESAV